MKGAQLVGLRERADSGSASISSSFKSDFIQLVAVMEYSN